MSGDADSSESPTAKWLTQDRRGDRGRIAGAGRGGGGETKRGATCEVSHITESVTNQSDCNCVCLSMCINIFLLKML